MNNKTFRRYKRLLPYWQKNLFYLYKENKVLFNSKNYEDKYNLIKKLKSLFQNLAIIKNDFLPWQTSQEIRFYKKLNKFLFLGSFLNTDYESLLLEYLTLKRLGKDFEEVEKKIIIIEKKIFKEINSFLNSNIKKFNLEKLLPKVTTKLNFVGVVCSSLIFMIFFINVGNSFAAIQNRPFITESRRGEIIIEMNNALNELREVSLENCFNLIEKLNKEFEDKIEYKIFPDGSKFPIEIEHSDKSKLIAKEIDYWLIQSGIYDAYLFDKVLSTQEDFAKAAYILSKELQSRVGDNYEVQFGSFQSISEDEKKVIIEHGVDLSDLLPGFIKFKSKLKGGIFNFYDTEKGDSFYLSISKEISISYDRNGSLVFSLIFNVVNKDGKIIDKTFKIAKFMIFPRIIKN